MAKKLPFLKRPWRIKPPRRPRKKWNSPPTFGSVTANVLRFYRENGRQTWAPTGVPSPVVSSYGSFSGIPLVIGNRRDPNDVYYIVKRKSGFTGTFWSEVDGSLGGTKISGPLWSHANPRSIVSNTLNPRDFGLREQAVRTAWHKVWDYALGSDLNLGVDVAEWRQTRDMLSKRINQLEKLGKRLNSYSSKWWKKIQYNLTHKDKPGSRHYWIPKFLHGSSSFSEVASKTWLEWKLGWTPLLSSLFGAVDHVRNIARRFRVVGNSKKSGSHRFVEKQNGMYVWSDVEIEAKAKVSIDLQVTAPIVYDATRIASLNPISYLWELTRLSFVVDYFVNIGRWLREMETAFASGLSFVRGFETWVERVTIKSTLPIQRTRSPGFFTVVPGTVYGKEYQAEKRRTKLTSMPWPKVPIWEPKVGAHRLLTMAALWRTMFFKK